MLTFIASIASAGCSVTAAKSFKSVVLQPDEGILGIVLFSDNAIRSFSLRGSNGDVVSRSDLGAGKHLLLFKVRENRYCIDRIVFRENDIKFRAISRFV